MLMCPGTIFVVVFFFTGLLNVRHITLFMTNKTPIFFQSGDPAVSARMSVARTMSNFQYVFPNTFFSRNGCHDFTSIEVSDVNVRIIVSSSAHIQIVTYTRLHFLLESLQTDVRLCAI